MTQISAAESMSRVPLLKWVVKSSEIRNPSDAMLAALTTAIMAIARERCQVGSSGRRCGATIINTKSRSASKTGSAKGGPSVSLSGSSVENAIATTTAIAAGQRGSCMACAAVRTALAAASSLRRASACASAWAASTPCRTASAEA